MGRDYIVGNVPAWAVGIYAAISAQDWNTLILPIIVSAISAVSFAYRAAANREERRKEKHQANLAKCEAILAQQAVCNNCRRVQPLEDCDFAHRPHDCPKNPPPQP